MAVSYTGGAALPQAASIASIILVSIQLCPEFRCRLLASALSYLAGMCDALSVSRQSLASTGMRTLQMQESFICIKGKEGK